MKDKLPNLRGSFAEMPQMIFIDFEASSLSADSWPIELGICWINEQNKLRVEAKLIKPHVSWQMSEWSEFSQKVHGITLDEIRAAEDAMNVAQWAKNRLTGSLLLSDASDFDNRWLDKLLATVPASDALEVNSIQKHAEARFDGNARAMFFKAYANGYGTHRAAGDALRLGQAWRSALRKEQTLLAKAR